MPRSRLLVRALLPASVIASNISNFLVVWLAAFALSASEFGLFSFWLATAQLLTVIAFDWLRTAVIRWSDGRPELLASIFRLYGLLGGSLVAVGASGWALGLGPTALLVASYSVGQASFDLMQAYFRSHFDDRQLVLSALARATISPIVCYAAMELAPLHDIGVGALGASFLVVSGYPLWRVVRKLPLAQTTANREELRRALGLGATMSVANLLYYGLQSATRGLAILMLPLTEAAAVVFTLDVVQRLFVALGTALNLLVLQRGIVRVEKEGQSVLPAVVGGQIALGYALIMPAFIGFCVVADAFATHLVPDLYQKGFMQFAVLAALSAALMTLKVYSLDTAFVLFGRGSGAVMSTAAGAVVTLIAMISLHYAGVGSVSIWTGLILGSLAGLSLSYFAIASFMKVRWAFRDLTKSTLASVPLLALLVVPFRDGVWFLVAAPVAGAAVYGGLLYLSKAFRSGGWPPD